VYGEFILINFSTFLFPKLINKLSSSIIWSCNGSGG